MSEASSSDQLATDPQGRVWSEHYQRWIDPDDLDLMDRIYGEAVKVRMTARLIASGLNSGDLSMGDAIYELNLLASGVSLPFDRSRS